MGHFLSLFSILLTECFHQLFFCSLLHPRIHLFVPLFGLFYLPLYICSSFFSIFFCVRYTFLCNLCLFFLLSFSSMLQGICPGNRLKIISYEATCYKPSPVSSPCPSMPSIYYNNSILSSADSILYENTVGFGGATSPNHQKLQGKRRSWHIMPNKVLCYHYYFISLSKVFSNH